MKVTSIQISFLSHETEDLNKVLNNLDEFLGNYSDYAEKTITEALGHYGDRIDIVNYIFKGNIINNLFNLIMEKMDKADLILALSTFDNRFANGKLYLRFDKQEIVANKRLVLKDGDDVIKIVISLKGNPKEIKEEIEKIASNRALHTKI